MPIDESLGMPIIGAMLTEDVLTYFNGSRTALAAALNIRPESTYDWGDRVPDLRQLQLEMYSEGALQAEERLKPAPRISEEGGRASA